MTVNGQPDRRPGQVLVLDDPRARRAALAGAKAAHLATAAHAGLRVLPGFVVLPPGSPVRGRDLRTAWRELSAEGTVPLVVRSSSAHEDGAASSLAGQFTSLLDVRGWDAFRAALTRVRESADAAGEDAKGRGADAMPVLVQPLHRPRAGGVLFGADPVAGHTDRIVVSAVRGGPDQLVSGTHPGHTVHLTRRGRPLRADSTARAADAAPPVLSPRELRRLAALARRTARVFGGPQDVEFGVDAADGRLWLYQSRPITAMAARPGRRARRLGPGPVAETLPGVIQPLEEDLWVVPMAQGLASALDIGGAAPRRRLRTVPVVTTVDGRAVADLDLLGVDPAHRRGLRRWLNPLPGGRRLAAAWRVGRLRAMLPRLATALAADVDRELAQAPPPGKLTPHALPSALRWSRGALVALHAQEALAGALLPAGDGTAAGRALAALAAGRARGLDDATLVTAAPEVLALIPPRLAGPGPLPDAAAPGGEPADAAGAGPPLPPREALRLRIRWVQEYQARLVREIAVRNPGLDAARAAQLRWSELLTAAAGHGPPAGLADRAPRTAAAPLPDAFRLAGDVVVPEPPGARADGDHRAGRGVCGGRAAGTAWDGTGSPPADAVLVVRTLHPALAGLLPAVRGLVAQTGSPLSHLAVLARELRLPAVTNVRDAVYRFPDGSPVLVDGGSGAVTRPVDTPPAAETTGTVGTSGTSGSPGPPPAAEAVLAGDREAEMPA